MYVEEVWSLQPLDGDAGGPQKDAGRLQRVFVFPPLTPTTPGCRSLALKSPHTVEIRLYSLVLCQNILQESTGLFYNVHATMSNFFPKDKFF